MNEALQHLKDRLLGLVGDAARLNTPGPHTTEISLTGHDAACLFARLDAKEQYVIINDGECCHYQIEGGVWTDLEKAMEFRDALVAAGRYKHKHLRITPVKVNPTLADFKNNTLGKPETSIWP
jgi:hypothetical protein